MAQARGAVIGHQQSYADTRLDRNTHSTRCTDSLVIRLQSDDRSIDKYPAKSHARRVAEKLNIQKGLIALSGTPSVLYPNSDQTVIFRQDRYFYYLTGCNEPGCYVTYNVEEEKLTLWLPAIDKSRVVWTGRGSTVEEALEKYDIDHARYISKPKKNVTKHLLAHGKKAGVASPVLLHNYIQSYMCHEDYENDVFAIMGAKADKALKKLLNTTEKEKRFDLKLAMNACREMKDEHEIELIRKANDITAEAHKAVLSNLHRINNEAEVEAEYMRVCIARHAREQAYAPIAGSGPNASELHYGDNSEDFGDRQMMVLDAGCEVERYASDVTRTLPLSKSRPGFWPSEEAENVYKLVESIQEACIKQMVPGNSFAAVTKLSQELTLDGLLELGLLKGDREEIRKAGTYLGFFPHGLGHHMGLEVHDVSSAGRPPRLSNETDEQLDYWTLKHADGDLHVRLTSSDELGTRTCSIELKVANMAVEAYEADLAAAHRLQEPPDHYYNRVALALVKLNPHVLTGDIPLLRQAVNVYLDIYHPVPAHYHDLGSGYPRLVPGFDFAPTPLRMDEGVDDRARDNTTLQPGMVITIEPGIYFNDFLLKNFFLNNPVHSKFIDTEVLERYMPVGGVRIEDDILVTREGYENLTTAPKGEEMLRWIRRGAREGGGKECDS